MRSQLLALLGLFATSAIASRSGSQLQLLKILGKKNVDGAHNLHGLKLHDHAKAKQAPSVAARADSRSGSSPNPHLFLNERTKRFAVDGKKIPELHGDAGESYAGQLPISDKKDEKNNFFFWFFPSGNEEHKKKKEITIWLNGGPGCSSLLGLLKENGPFVWPTGTMKPLLNPWSFHLLTNVVWVEQPVSVGFSTGKPTIHNEDELAEQFMGFWKNFMETFSMQGYKVFIVGESYAGYYGSYISSHFINAKNPTYYGLEGLMIVDGASFSDDVQTEVVAAAYVEQNYNLFAFDDVSMQSMRKTARVCGYEDYVKKYYRYPPSGPQPAVLPWTEKLADGTINYKVDCGHLWRDIVDQAATENPCFNPYNIRDYCPVQFDPIVDSPYFDREDVKRAIHAPLDVKWTMCVNTSFVGEGDKSEPPSKYELPNVIDKTQNVIFAQGGMDFMMPPSGVLLGIQNMTWGRKMGFQSPPTDPFYVPRWGLGELNGTFYGSDLSGLSGVVGTTHTERGLTVAITRLAGHEGPEYAPTASLRQLEKLLGRVHSLSSTEPFTLPQLAKIGQLPATTLGKGTYPVPWLPNSYLGK